MNQKATKQTLQWPPLYQLMHDEPVVDSSFRNVERLNAPYLNDMLSPVWIQDTGSKAIYDKDGNRYEIKDGWLTRNDENLFAVTSKKFVREDVTEDLNKYHDYDLTDNHEAYTIWNSEYNSFYMFIDDQAYATASLFDEGVVVSSRIRIIDNKAVLVVYYDIDDVGYVNVYTLDTDGNFTSDNRTARWFRHQIRLNTSTAPIYTEYTIENAAPIINIGKVDSNVIAISLVSGYGKAVNTSRHYFITLFVTPNKTYQLGVDAAPTSETTETVVSRDLSIRFRTQNIYTKTNVSGTCISADNSTYYDYSTENVVGENLNIPTTYTPTATGNTVTIDNVEYTIYNYTATRVDSLYKVDASDGGDEEWQLVGTSKYDGVIYQTELDSTASKQIAYSYLAWRGQEITESNTRFTNVIINWRSHQDSLPENYTATTVVLHRDVTETINAGWLVSPNIVIDDGSFYSMWALQLGYSEANNWANQTLTVGNIIEESGLISTWTEENDSFSYTIAPTEFVTITSDYRVARSNSFITNQNIAIDTVKLNNTLATSSYTLYNNGGTAGSESTSSKFLEYSNSNCTDLRYYPGTTRDSSFNYFGNQMFSGDTVVGNVEDQPLFVVQGYRTPVHSADRFMLGSKATPFNILYNTDASGLCLAQSISYSEDTDAMGTLLAPWQTIDDDFYIAANSTSVVYRDKSNRYYKITIEDGNDLVSLLDDRYILVNTTSYWNMFDSVLLKKFHYATDYNDRTMFGQTAVPSTIIPGANSSGSITYSRYTATAINAAYAIMPMLAVTSILLPVNIRLRVGINAEKAFRCNVTESTDNQPIDIYYGNVGATAAEYRYSLYPYNIYDRTIRFDLTGSSYTISNGLYLSPNIFTEYISGAGNNDMVKETYSTYVLTYYDNQPFFLYNASSEVASKNGDNIYFFVIQGQFYACMNEKIYSMIYSSGAISSQEAIADTRGLIFLGNNTQIAFFYSPRNRSIYSFTGDANLAHLYNADKLTGITSKHWYDETTQSIYVPSDYGLLVFGPNNVYVFEQWKNVTNCQFDNKEVTHITNGDTTINLTYYNKEDYEILPVDLETSFYGIGSNEYTAIDRWDIVLFDRDGTKPSTEITVGVRTITDITVKSEEKTFKITPDMWDKWSNSVLLRYVPKLQKGQGIRLYLKTPMVVQRIVPHIMDMQTGTPTKRGM